jgi:hypothetical protein
LGRCQGEAEDAEGGRGLCVNSIARNEKVW